MRMSDPSPPPPSCPPAHRRRACLPSVAILAAILETYPVEPEAVEAAIRQMLPEVGEAPAGNPAVQSVVDSLLKTSGK